MRSDIPTAELGHLDEVQEWANQPLLLHFPHPDQMPCKDVLWTDAVLSVISAGSATLKAVTWVFGVTDLERVKSSHLWQHMGRRVVGRLDPDPQVMALAGHRGFTANVIGHSLPVAEAKHVDSLK